MAEGRTTVSGKKAKKFSYDQELYDSIVKKFEEQKIVDLSQYQVMFWAKEGLSPEQAIKRYKNELPESDGALFVDKDGRLNSNIPNFVEGNNKLSNAIRKNEKIGLISDYDNDGNTAAANTINLLTSIGHERFDIHIPNRFKEGEGYGLKMKAVDELWAKGCRFFVIHDMGTGSVEVAKHIRELGGDYVISDHHLAKGAYVKDAVNPKLTKEFNIDASASRLSQLQAEFVIDDLKRYTPAHISKRALEEFDHKLNKTIGTFGHVGDVMPTNTEELKKDYTKTMKVINSDEYPQFRALKGIFAVDEVDEGTITINFVPLGNAPGRLGEASHFARFLSLKEVKDHAPMIRDIVKKLNLTDEESKQYNAKNNYSEKLEFLQNVRKDLNSEILDEIIYAKNLISARNIVKSHHDFFLKNFDNNEVKERYIDTKDFNERTTQIIELVVRNLKAHNDERKQISNEIMLPKYIDIKEQKNAEYKKFLEKNPTVKSLREKIFKESKQLKQLKKEDVKLFNRLLNEPAVNFLVNDEAHIGINGIVASRIMETDDKPIFVGMKYTVEATGEEWVTGSWRSKHVDLEPLIDRIKEEGINMGGHKNAAGCSFKLSDLEKVEKITHEYLIEESIKTRANNSIEYIAEIDFKDATADKIEEIINAGKPYGPQNPKPNILFKNAQAKSARHSKTGLHASLSFGSSSDLYNKQILKGISFFNQYSEKEKMFFSDSRHLEEFDLVAIPSIYTDKKGAKHVYLSVEDITNPRKISEELLIQKTEPAKELSTIKEEEKKDREEIEGNVKIAQNILKGFIEDQKPNEERDLRLKTDPEFAAKHTAEIAMRQKFLKQIHDANIVIYDKETTGKNPGSHDPKKTNATTQMSAIKVNKKLIASSGGEQKEVYEIEEFNRFNLPVTPRRYEYEQKVKSRKKENKDPEYNPRIHEYVITKEALNITQTKIIRETNSKDSPIVGLEVLGQPVEAKKPYETIVEFLEWCPNSHPVGFNNGKFDNQGLGKEFFDVINAGYWQDTTAKIKSYNSEVSDDNKIDIKIDDRIKIDPEFQPAFREKYSDPIIKILSEKNKIAESIINPAKAIDAMVGFIVQKGERAKNNLDASYQIYLDEPFKLNLPDRYFDIRDHTMHDAVYDSAMVIPSAAQQVEYFSDKDEVGNIVKYKYPSIANAYEKILKDIDPRVQIIIKENDFDNESINSIPFLPKSGDITIKFSDDFRNNPQASKFNDYLMSLREAYLKSGTEIAGRLYGRDLIRIEESQDGDITLIGRKNIESEDIRNINFIKHLLIVKKLYQSDLVEEVKPFDRTSAIDITLAGDGSKEERTIRDVKLSSLRFSQQYLFSEEQLTVEKLASNIELLNIFRDMPAVGDVSLRKDGVTIKGIGNFCKLDIKIPVDKDPVEFINEYKTMEFLVKIGNIPGMKKAERSFLNEEDEDEDDKISKNQQFSVNVDFNKPPQFKLNISKELFDEVIRNQKANGEELGNVSLSSGSFILPGGIRGDLDNGEYILRGNVESFIELYTPIRDSAWAVYSLSKINDNVVVESGKAIIKFDDEDSLKASTILTKAHVTHAIEKGKAIIDMESFMDDAYQKGELLKKEIDAFKSFETSNKKQKAEPSNYIDNALYKLDEAIKNNSITSYRVFDSKNELLFFITDDVHKDIPLKAVPKQSPLPIEFEDFVKEIPEINVTLPAFYISSLTKPEKEAKVAVKTKKSKNKIELPSLFTEEQMNLPKILNLEPQSFKEKITISNFNSGNLYFNSAILLNSVNKIKNITDVKIEGDSNSITFKTDKQKIINTFEILYNSGLAFEYNDGKVSIDLKYNSKRENLKTKEQSEDSSVLSGIAYEISKSVKFWEKNVTKEDSIYHTEELKYLSGAVKEGKIIAFSVFNNKTIEIPQINNRKFNLDEQSEFPDIIKTGEGRIDPLESETQYRRKFNLLNLKLAISDGAVKEISKDFFLQLTKLNRLDLVAIEKIDINSDGEVSIQLPRIRLLEEKESYLSALKKFAITNQSVHLHKIKTEFNNIENSSLISRENLSISSDFEKKNDEITKTLGEHRKNLSEFAFELGLMMDVDLDKSYQQPFFKDISRLNILRASLNNSTKTIEKNNIFGKKKEDIFEQLHQTRSQYVKAEGTLERLRGQVTENLKAINEITLEYDLENIKYKIVKLALSNEFSDSLEKKYINKYMEIYPISEMDKDTDKDKKIKKSYESLAKLYASLHNREGWIKGFDSSLSLDRAYKILSDDTKCNYETSRVFQSGPRKGLEINEALEKLQELTKGYTETYPAEKLYRFANNSFNKFQEEIVKLQRTLENVPDILKPVVDIAHDKKVLERLTSASISIVEIGEINVSDTLGKWKREGKIKEFNIERGQDDNGELRVVKFQAKDLLKDIKIQDKEAKRLAELNKGKEELPKTSKILLDTSPLMWLINTTKDIRIKGEKTYSDYGAAQLLLELAKTGICEYSIPSQVVAEYLNGAADINKQRLDSYNPELMVYEKNGEIKEYPKKEARPRLLKELQDLGALEIIETKVSEEYLDRIKQTKSLQNDFERLFPDKGPLLEISNEHFRDILLSNEPNSQRFINKIRELKLRSDTGEISIADATKQLYDKYGKNIDLTICYQASDVRGQIIRRLNNTNLPYKNGDVEPEYNPNLSSKFNEEFLKVFGSNTNGLTTVSFLKSCMKKTQELKGKYDINQLYLFHPEEEQGEKGFDISIDKLLRKSGKNIGNIKGGFYKKEKNARLINTTAGQENEYSDIENKTGPFDDILDRIDDRKWLKIIKNMHISHDNYYRKDAKEKALDIVSLNEKSEQSTDMVRLLDDVIEKLKNIKKPITSMKQSRISSVLKDAKNTFEAPMSDNDSEKTENDKEPSMVEKITKSRKKPIITSDTLKRALDSDQGPENYFNKLLNPNRGKQ